MLAVPLQAAAMYAQPNRNNGMLRCMTEANESHESSNDGVAAGLDWAKDDF
jgi:hypothetical protein